MDCDTETLRVHSAISSLEFVMNATSVVLIAVGNMLDHQIDAALGRSKDVLQVSGYTIRAAVDVAVEEVHLHAALPNRHELMVSAIHVDLQVVG